MPVFTPTTPDDLVTTFVQRCMRTAGVVVAAVDGADAARPRVIAERIGTELRAGGRAADIVDLHDFVRPASTRMEYGHTDAESYRTMWFDYAALDREVLTSLRTEGRWLPRLWDADTDRSPRDPIRRAADDHVLVVAGPMLLGRGLGFDVSLRLIMSAAALARRTPPEEAWTIPALLEHQESIEHQKPSDDHADIDARWDHPDRPAVRARR